MASAQRHREISERFLSHAQREFDNGDLLQASEKAWGAVAHRVKAIAREQGWPNKSHTDVRNNARRLLARSADPVGNRFAFRSVERLHNNFYEEDLSAVDVLIGIADATALVEVLNDIDAQMPP